MKPIVAIVGRPNVGKSSIFNRIAGRRISIVEDTPGVTRDRIYAECEWRLTPFLLIDTGGIEPDSKDEILTQMRRQAQAAIENADVVILLVDMKTGLTSTDQDVASMLQKSGKPIILSVNKVDNVGEPPADFYEFYNLGLGQPYAVSASHNLGFGDLLDAAFEYFPKQEGADEEDDTIKVAIVGRPNAGKSSLINHLLGEDRMIVSDIPGTTRDSVDSYVERGGKKYLMIDTAGIRRKSKVDEAIERYSVMRSIAAIERCDVCILMIDTSEGVTEQDAKIAGLAHESGKATLILANKWDLVDKDTHTMKAHTIKIKEQLSFMTYAPIEFISAATGSRIDKIFPLIDLCAEKNATRITTGALNDIINEATLKVQPPADKGKRLKIYYATQPSTKPPTFVVFVNDYKLAHYSYVRYLENQVREAFSLDYTPLKFIIRQRGQNDYK